MWRAIKEHSVVATTISLFVGLGAVIAVLAGLANIWVAMSRDTVPEFLTKRGWAMALPPWQAAVAICFGLVILVLQFAILREAYKQPPIPNVLYPVVVIYEHLNALNSPATNQVRALFERAGWKVNLLRTDVPRHANGVWLHGGTDIERNVARWGLHTVGIAPQIDYHDDKPPSLQVIVGAFQLQDRRDEAAQIVAQRDSLKVVLEETQREREAIRGALGDEIARLKDAREVIDRERLMCKRSFALARISWFGELTRINNWPFFQVIIRFADYKDFALAERLEQLLKEQTKWAAIRLDGMNNPVLKPDRKFKVIFVSGTDQRFDPLITAVQDGNLLECSIGQRIDAQHDLVIEVLPTVEG